MPEIMKKIYVHITCTVLLIIACIVPVFMHAQSAKKMERRANTHFQNKDYYQAAKLYSAILYDSPLVNTNSGILYPFQSANKKSIRKVRPSERGRVVYQLAESYRLYNQYHAALAQYEQYFLSQNTQFPLARLWYGICLIAHDEPVKAITAFNTFLQTYKVQDSFAQKARSGIATGNFYIRNKSLPPKALLTQLRSVISVDGSNFALDKINDSSFWFTTSRHELSKAKEKVYPLRLYSGSFTNNTTKQVIGFLSNDMNMGASSLSADGLTLYFTGWKEDAKSPAQPNYHIFYSTRSANDATWSAPIVMAAPVNMAGFNSKQPFITRDNKQLLFISDQPGGYGKEDIWMVTIEGIKPAGPAINLGSNINTNETEASPFYDAALGRLYFSSNGRTGMGGMDIFEISGSTSSNQWSGSVTNLGLPVNSVKDDLYYTKAINSDTAYLSSDRSSSCCLEIFRAVNLPYTDTVKSNGTPLVLSNPIRNRQQDSVAEENIARRRLLDSVNAVTIERMQINYHFASAKIRKADYPQLDKVIQTMEQNPALNILVASFTDCIGSKSANELLSRKRSESVKAYLRKRGIDANRINIDFFGKKHFIVACKEDSSYKKEKQIANRRSDLIITTEQNPRWQPSGKELDIQEILSDSSAVAVYSKDRTDTYTNKGNEQSGYSKLISKRDEAGKTQSKRSGTFGKEQRNASGNLNGKDNSGNNIRKQQSIKTILLPDLLKTTTSTAELSKNGFVRIPVDSIQYNMKITELLDFIPILKKPNVIEEVTRRTPRKSFEVYSTSDSVKIELYDNGVFDYDSVSVIYNKELVVYKNILQTSKPISFYVKLDPDPRKNEMIFFAENLGLTPPNSALMVITDGHNKRTEVNVSSDLLHNSVIYFIKIKK